MASEKRKAQNRAAQKRYRQRNKGNLWGDRNPERAAEIRRNSPSQQRDAVAERMRKWRKAHPEVVKARNAAYRAAHK